MDSHSIGIPMNRVEIFVMGDPILDVYHLGTWNSKKKRFNTKSIIEVPGGAANVAKNLEDFGYYNIIKLYPQYKNYKLHRLIDEQTQEILIEIPEPSPEIVNLSTYYNPADFYEQVLPKWEQYVSTFWDQVNDISVLIISDYNKGMVNRTCENLLRYLKSLNLDYVIVDSRYGTVDNALIDLGKTKILHATGSEIALSRYYNYDWILNTNGSGPIYITNPKLEIESTIKVPVVPNIVDETGAGDTFVASIVDYIITNNIKQLSIYDIKEATRHAISNCSVVIQKLGTATVKSSSLEIRK